MNNALGILLVNTGTPDDPSPVAVKKYLREFLADHRIIQLPRMIWLPILYGLILPLRPKKVAKLYRKIWYENGSPMRVIMEDLKNNMLQHFERTNQNISVEVGMNYGNPSIKQALIKLKYAKKIMILPLFPQYSYTTTASTIDRLIKAINILNFQPQLSFIQHYSDHPIYIEALANQVKNHWKKTRSQKLMISFHGMPIKYVQNGDPYESHCRLTAHALAETLNLNRDEWVLTYQSQFGYAKWLKPSLQTLLAQLPKIGIKTLDIICPGFSVECLETLEEVAYRGTRLFQKAGGQTLNYIPTLNASDLHLKLILALCNQSNMFFSKP